MPVATSPFRDGKWSDSTSPHPTNGDLRHAKTVSIRKSLTNTPSRASPIYVALPKSKGRTRHARNHPVPIRAHATFVTRVPKSQTQIPPRQASLCWKTIALASHQVHPLHDDAVLLPDDRLHDPNLPGVVAVHDVHLVASKDLRGHARGVGGKGRGREGAGSPNRRCARGRKGGGGGHRNPV